MVDESGPRNSGESAADGGNRAPGASIECPSCGVAVAPGYPKCPKCHARLPYVPSPLHRVGSMASGGTSAADSGGGAGMWAVVAAIVIIAGAVTFFVMRGRGGDGAAADDYDAGAEQATSAVDTTADDSAALAPAAGFDDDEDRVAVDTAVLDELSAKLAELRLWSSVDPEPADDTIIRIVSSHCEDGGLRRAVTSFAEAMKAAGFVRVQCFTQHGALSFEREL